MSSWLRSLRMRLLLPIVAAATPAAILVAVFSFYLGKDWALRDVDRRQAAIQETLDNSSFPLSSNVVNSLSSLTDAEWVTFTPEGKLDVASSGVLGPEIARLSDASSKWSQNQIDLAQRSFLLRRCTYGSQATQNVYLLFDRSSLDTVSRRYAGLPLLTGLSTILVLSTSVWVLLRPVLLRLESIQQRVTRIAAGDFSVRCNDSSPDEIGLLGGAVDSMAEQLEKLWQEVNIQQATKLLHQLAGGLAHQLRNTLTGSKMAIELFVNRERLESEEIDVALSQLNVAEGYVQRLLLVSKGDSASPEPATVASCLRDVCKTLAPVATHLGKQLQLHEPAFECETIKDRACFVDAISNLILNAIHASKHSIVVTASFDSGVLKVKVEDDGDGIDLSVAESLFEPFVSTKPEGIGLGLPTVLHAANRLDGSVSWNRNKQTTTFEFCCPFQSTLQ